MTAQGAFWETEKSEAGGGGEPSARCQVHAAALEPGEERALRRRLRRMTERRGAVARCQLVGQALAGEGGGGAGGLDDGLRTVEGHLSAILGVEEAHAALAGGAGEPDPNPDQYLDTNPEPDAADDGAAAAVEAALSDVSRARAALADAGAKAGCPPRPALCRDCLHRDRALYMAKSMASFVSVCNGSLA